MINAKEALKQSIEISSENDAKIFDEEIEAIEMNIRHAIRNGKTYTELPFPPNNLTMKKLTELGYRLVSRTGRNGQEYGIISWGEGE